MALFNGLGPDFEDFTYLSGNFKCKVHFSQYGFRFKRAQEWLEKTFVEKMIEVMPRKTGALINRTVQKNAANYTDGWIETIGLDYGKKLYGGINPSTGKPWNWTNPATQPYWGEYTAQQYKPELVQGVKDIVYGRKKP